MVPNMIPMFLTLGLMGWLDIPVNLPTIIVGSLILGIAVDDTIHFMHKFNQYYIASGDTEAAIRETFATTGIALLATTIALASSFLVFGFSQFASMVQFGMLAGFATVIAFLADMLVAPALIQLTMGSARQKS